MVQYKIYPPIGVARLGDSPDEWFIGPEVPGADNRPPGGYKSADCRIKRQGARFRIFEFDDDGQPVLVGGQPKEITAAEAEISWTVQLANTKASAKRFYPVGDNTMDRNDGIDGADNRKSLEIVTEPATISGKGQSKPFAQGQFRGLPVKLGELKTDADGRLIVLGGHGVSRAVHPDGALWPDLSASSGPDTYDTDNWHDDVADGPVRAKVLIGGDSMDATPARVIVGPPDFAPPVQAIVSLYDRIEDELITAKALPEPQGPYSFVRDIRPVLQRAARVDAVHDTFGGHDGIGAAADDPHYGLRDYLFGQLVPPEGPFGVNTPPNMPKLFDDANQDGTKKKGFALSRRHYAAMQAWAKGTENGSGPGDWTNDWPPPPPAAVATPEGLARAALDACLGRGLRPGIEAGHFLTLAENYAEPFRLKDDIPAGAVTAQMAVPWQGDFASCAAESGWSWWPSHRPDSVWPEAGGKRRDWTDQDGLPHDPLFLSDWMVAHWSRLGFVVSRDGQLVETERTVACRNISVIANREAISHAQAAAALANAQGVIPKAVTARLGGCKPSDIKVPNAAPTPDQVAAIAPDWTLRTADGSPFAGFKLVNPALEMQDPANLGQTQILAFTYDVAFDDLTGFGPDAQPFERRDITLGFEIAWADGDKSGKAAGEGRLALTDLPTPFMLDGDQPWLSDDLRVFRVVHKGASPIPGVELEGGDAAAARAYVGKVLGKLNQQTLTDPATDLFEKLPTDQQDGALELYSATEDKEPVFNFAVARVRYQGQAEAAEKVRVFFRLFTTEALAMDYDQKGAYRRSTDLDAPVPLLGTDGAGVLVSMPFFAAPRIDSAATSLIEQSDPLNVLTLPPAAPGGETRVYFGCWLDINQPDPQFPDDISVKDGPWTSGRKPIQGLINGLHQCLIAEIDFPDQPIPAGATPGDDLRLAQRNLAWVDSDNPGGPETRTVQHSFMIKAPPRAPSDIDPAEELVLHWKGLPAGSRARVYMPDVEASEVMALAGLGMDYTGLRRIDAHTLECAEGDVTYIPLPPGRSRHIAALLSIELPEGVRKGQLFHCLVDQVWGRRERKVRGSFQLNIPIGTARTLLAPERRRLSLLRFLFEAKAPDDPWRAVLGRYVAEAAARVKGYGGDPDKVTASPDGNGKAGSNLACRLLGGLFALALTALVVVGGLATVPSTLTVLGAAGLALLLGVTWVLACKPGLKRFGLMFGGGVALGAAVLGVAALLGLGGAGIAVWLPAAAAVGAPVLLAALLIAGGSP